MGKIFIVFLLALFIPLEAQEDVSNNETDYSKRFEVFYRLGLPDVSKAKYVRCYIGNQNPQQYYMPVFSWPGWLLEEKTDGPSLLVEWNAIKVLASKATNAETDSNEFKGSWEEVDPREDIRKLLTRLGNADSNTFSYCKFFYGTAFLYAIQFHSKGFKKEANQIISRLFELTGDKKRVLLEAMNSLANQQYNQILLELHQNRNWEKFEASLEELLKKYPRGWKAAPHIRFLLKKVKQQIANPAPPELNGEGITPKQQKLAAELLQLKEMPLSYGMPLILPNLPINQKKSLESKVRAGRELIPILLALLEDEYMLPICKNNEFFFNSRNDSDKKQEERLSEIPHPAMRKDVARALLLPLLPLSPNKRWEMNEMNDEGFIRICQKWYNETKAMTEDELLLYYLKNGEEEQQGIVTEAILDANEEKYLPVTEKFLLDMEKEKLEEILCLLLENTAKRRKAAQPFVEKLREKFKDELQEAQQNEKAIREAEADKKYPMDESLKKLRDTRRILDELSELASGKDAKELIDEIISGKTKLSNRIINIQLKPALDRLDNDEAIGVLLYGAVKTDSLCMKKCFLDECKWMSRYEKYKDNRPFSISKNAEAWKVLLADKSEYHPAYDLSTSIDMLAAFSMEEVYAGTDKMREMIDIKNRLGQRAEKIILKRAEERLAGKTEKELTPYPELKKLSADEAGQLKADIEKAVAEKQAAKFLNALDDKRFAALSEIIRKNPGLNAGLKDYANRIVRVESPNRELDKFKDTVLDKAKVEDIQNYCRKLAIENKRFICTISRKPAFAGVSISITESPEEFQKITIETVSGEEIRHNRSYMRGSISTIRRHADSSWSTKNEDEEHEVVINGKKVKLESDAATTQNIKKDKESHKKFEKCLEEVFGNDVNCANSLFIIYQNQ